MNVRGFLIDPSEWDEHFAAHRAYEMKIPHLTARHWQIIYYLREMFAQTGRVPNVYETVEANGLELDDLECLFPDGYHRGAVKISGLRSR